MNIRDRNEILVIGGAAVNAAPFDNRRLKLVPKQLEDLQAGAFAAAHGIVVAPLPGKPRLIEEYFRGPFAESCSFGLRTALFTTDGDAIKQFAQSQTHAFNRLNVAPPKPNPDAPTRPAWAFVESDSEALAEEFARSDPGPEPGNPEIVCLTPNVALEPGTEFLLKRAFADCDKLIVERLSGGKSAKDTFRVRASLKGPESGRQPMPFFLKQGTPNQIEEEKENYRHRAVPFIPFHLRPALNEQRSLTTLTDAVLVCDFVEGGVSLRHALRADQADGVIYTLFEVTLRALRSHAMKTPPVAGALATFLRDRIRSREITAERIARAQRLGLTRNPGDIETQMIARAANEPSRSGTYHGDLHFGNVFARYRDAILIDFGSMKFGPLTADPAILEVSLIFGTDAHDDPNDFDDWRRLVGELYLGESDDAALRAPILTADLPRFAWLRKAVREVRVVGAPCEATDLERRIVLIGCVLRFARLSPFDLGPELHQLAEDRRAYALVIAERLADRL